MNLDKPRLLADIDSETIRHMAEEFAIQWTAMLLRNAKKHLGPMADSGPEITDVLMELNRGAFVGGFKVAQRIHFAETEH